MEFFIVSALALQENFQTKNHGQLMGGCNREFIKTERIEKNIPLFIAGLLITDSPEIMMIL